MSLDLHEIGANLILNNGINAGLEGASGKVAAVQDARDRVHDELGVTSSALADLSSSTADIAASWSLFAEAAEGVTEAADRTYSLVPIASGAFVPDVSGAMNEARAGDYSGWSDFLADGTAHRALIDAFTQIQRRLGEQYGASVADVTDHIGISYAPLEQLAGNPEDDAKCPKDSKAGNGGFVLQLAEISRAMQGYGDESGVAQRLSPVRPDDYGNITKWHDADGSTNPDAIEGFVASFRRRVGDGGDRVGLQDYRTLPGSMNLEGLDDRGVLSAASMLLASENSNAVFGTTVPAQTMAADNSDELGRANDQASLERESISWLCAASDQVFMGHMSDAYGAALNAIYSDNSLPSGDGFAAEALFQKGLLQRQLVGVGAIPDTSKLQKKLDFETGNPAFLDAYNRAIEVGFPATGSEESIFDLGSGSPRVHDKINDDVTKRGTAIGDATIRADNEGIAFSTPPGWLVALTSAVVTELRSSAFDDFGRTEESQASRPQNHLGPSGTRNDPLYVKVVDPLIAYQTRMPAGSTASLPSQSLPIPGQVSFSP